jgi:hypothetical protein
VCSVATPNAAFTGITWTDADVTLTAGAAQFDMNIATSDLDAQNGEQIDPATANTITGTITVDSIPLTIDTALDPGFDADALLASWHCDSDGGQGPTTPVEAVVEPMCNFKTVLAHAAAGLLTKSVGVATNVLKADGSCGFSTPAVVGAGQTNQLSPGPPPFGTFTLSVTDCDKNLGATTDVPLGAPTCDISGGQGVTVQTSGHGTLNVTGTEVITGVLTGQAPPSNIVPIARDGVDFTLASLGLNGFHLADSVGGAPPETESTVTGTFVAAVTPILAQSDGTTAALGGIPAYTISVPVAAISYTADTATLVLVSDGNTFNLDLTDVDLDAFTGSWDGSGTNPAAAAVENEVSGTLTVDGFPVTLTAGTTLDPAFNQALLDASYACTADLTGRVPPKP